MCDTENSENDEFHLRGKMLTNQDGYYEFHTIQPGHYESRPKHFHIKFTGIGKTIEEQEKAWNIDDMLIRYLTVKVKKHNLEENYFEKKET